MCKSSLHTGTAQYVHSYVSVAKNSDFHSSFASISTGNSLISLTLFRWYTYMFFVQSLRSISWVASPWSLAHGIFQLIWKHSRTACGIVLTILESILREKLGKVLIGVLEVEVAAIMVPWKWMELMMTGTWILWNGVMKLSGQEERQGCFWRGQHSGCGCRLVTIWRESYHSFVISHSWE